MRSDCPIERNLRDRQDVVLRAAETRGLTNALLAAAAGISPDTLRMYRRTDAREPSIMPLDNFIKVARALTQRGHGDLASLLIEDSGCRLAPIDPEAANWDGIAAETATLTAAICTARIDGQIDHRERAAIVGLARPLMQRLQHVTAESGNG